MTDSPFDLRLIATDLDGTFLYDNETVSPANRAAIKAAADAGVIVAAATGRPFSAIPACIKAMPEFRYAITSNGTAVYDMHTGKCLRRITLPRGNALQILELTKSVVAEAVSETAAAGSAARTPLLDIYAAGSSVREPLPDLDSAESAVHAPGPVMNVIPCAGAELFLDGVPYTSADAVAHPERYGFSEGGQIYIRKTRQPVEDMYAFLEAAPVEPDGIDLLTADSVLKEMLVRRITAEIPGIRMTSSMRNRIEIMEASAGKGSALVFLMEMLGIHPEQTAAFGDADNDADMLQAAGCGVAVANASQGCLDAADLITGSCREDGAAQALRKLMHIQTETTGGQDSL